LWQYVKTMRMLLDWPRMAVYEEIPGRQEEDPIEVGGG
jgi:hypothetical protein